MWRPTEIGTGNLHKNKRTNGQTKYPLCGNTVFQMHDEIGISGAHSMWIYLCLYLLIYSLTRVVIVVNVVVVVVVVVSGGEMLMLLATTFYNSLNTEPLSEWAGRSRLQAPVTHAERKQHTHRERASDHSANPIKIEEKKNKKPTTAHTTPQRYSRDQL